jgi:glycosyltransferase involved in cell wall biosynthesis
MVQIHSHGAKSVVLKRHPMRRIIAFTKDWNDVPTCTTHILREMGRTMPVLWVNSIGMRKPQFTRSGDWRRVIRKLLTGLRRAEIKENQLRVLSPLVLPKANSNGVRAINRWLIQWQIGRELRRMGQGPVEYWCFVPNAVDLLPPVTAAKETTDHRPQTTDRDGEERVCASREGAKIAKDELLSAGVGSEVSCLRSVASRATRVIYYGVDDWSKFPGIDREWVLDCEQRMLERADVVFVASRYLEARWRPIAGERVHYMPHGVWHEKFAAAVKGMNGSGKNTSHEDAKDAKERDSCTANGGGEKSSLRALRLGVQTSLDAQRSILPDVAVPSDLAALPAPRIGFYGNLYDWIDFELLEQLATARPQWSFVMIGPEYCDVSRLRATGNIHFLGRREPSELPAYCKGFDAGLIPYKLADPRMESVNPVKLRELLAAGVPVVAADIPEVRGISDYVKTARTKEEFLAALETVLSAGYDRAAISDERRGDDWTVRVREIRRIVELE